MLVFSPCRAFPLVAPAVIRSKTDWMASGACGDNPLYAVRVDTQALEPSTLHLPTGRSWTAPVAIPCWKQLGRRDRLSMGQTHPIPALARATGFSPKAFPLSVL
jgi:hypothetical protein